MMALPAEPYPDSDGPRRGAPKQFDWTEHWVCGHSGKYLDERNPDLSPRKRRANRQHGSVKTQCTAFYWLRKVYGQDLVKIEYYGEHEGHEVGTVKEMTESMLPLRVKRWIQSRVDEGQAIKPMLRIDSEILDQVGCG
jgi:hypothetical protein